MPPDGPLRKVFLYADTLARLRGVQLTNRLKRTVWPPRVEAGRTPPPCSQPVAPWIPGVMHQATWDGSRTFRFLNRTEVVSWPGSWNDSALPLLWLYNLHYFADLHARDAGARRHAHRDLVDRWITDNPPAEGVGWAPYPVSLRIRNWVRWWVEGERPQARWVDSLAIQARWLERNLEYHLLGNHLLENAFALFAAGCWFDGAEGRSMRANGAELVTAQLQEQVLGDGGHFERSPMYHCLMLEGLLDSLNIGQVAGFGIPAEWRITARSMCDWLQGVLHPDGQIPLMNDAAFGVAASPADLLDYAERVLNHKTEWTRTPIVALRDSGYVVVRRQPWHGILDVGALGPGYLAAHGHADTLCCELSVMGRRLLVDPGTSTYANEPQRWYERSTAAHNTIAMDSRDSSNVWHAFRTGRQAIATLQRVAEYSDSLEVAAAHDGYAGWHGRHVHSREWRVANDQFVIRDYVSGIGCHHLSARYTLAPGWKISAGSDESCIAVDHTSGLRVRIACRGALSLRRMQGEYHPEFGVSEPVQAFECSGDVDLPAESELVFELNR